MEILGSSQGKELERPIKPKDFEKGFSEVQAKKGIEELMGKCVNGLMREKQWKIDKMIEPVSYTHLTLPTICSV